MSHGGVRLHYTIRNVTIGDIDCVANVESICFPASEAAQKEVFRERIAAFSDFFLVAESEGKIIGFINGCVTNSPVIYDEMFLSTSQHDPDGENLAVFGLDVLPQYRRQGMAAALMKSFIARAMQNGKKRVILTCKKRLIHYYESFGFVNEGVSLSKHGGAEWYDMTLVIKE